MGTNDGRYNSVFNQAINTGRKDIYNTANCHGYLEDAT